MGIIDLKFLLALLVFLGGVWGYLNEVILGLTTTEEDVPTLLTLSFMHYVVTVYIVLSLIIFYYQGVSFPNAPQPSLQLSFSEVILFQTWPLTIVVLLASFLSANWFHERAYNWIFIISSLGALAAFFLLIWDGKSSAAGSASWGEIGIFLVSLPIVATVYLMLMSFVLADVQIKTDKQFYAATDTIVVSVRAAGYVLRPELLNISCGAFERKIPSGQTLTIPPNRGHTGGLLLVTFQPQIVPVEKKRYLQLNIVEN